MIPQEELLRLERIEHAARELELFLSTSVGCTADWPMRLTADNDPDAEKAAQLLTNLTLSIREPKRNPPTYRLN